MFIKAWPFLVTRNQSIDYKTVVAPDFISLANIRSLLNKASDDDCCEQGKVYVRRIQGSKVGDFTIIFRVSRARQTDIGESGNDTLKDPFGREIYATKGFIVQEHPSQILHKIKRVHLKQVHYELIEKHRVFWNQDKISDSNAINLRDDESNHGVELEELEPFLISSTSQSQAIVPNKKPIFKSFGRNGKYTTLVIFALIISLSLILIGDVIRADQKSEQLLKCKYATTIMPINFENQGVNEALKELTQEYPQTLILLKGKLKFTDQKTSQESITDIAEIGHSNPQPTITKDETQLHITYHPINAAIALFKNLKIDVNNNESKMTAIIFETQGKDEQKRFCEMNFKGKQYFPLTSLFK
jgi:hypothetical protein